MAELKLVIGSKTYSSWSLRPWLLLRYHNVAFREIPIALNQADTHKRIAEYSPSGKVPVLMNGPEKVWESLAICEYAAETLKLPAAWPSDVTLRFQARSLACEMHSGFADLRRELPMDCRRSPAPMPYSAAVAADIARIRSIWRSCRQAHAKSGDWLFGKFGIVDAMFAPVVLRLHTYGVQVDGPERDYMTTVLHLPALREWLGAAMLETVSAPEASENVEASAPPAHHAPAAESIDADFLGSPLNPAYANNWGNRLAYERGPRLWIHGHMHCPKDYTIGDTQIICNPYGYPGQQPGSGIKYMEI